VKASEPEVTFRPVQGRIMRQRVFREIVLFSQVSPEGKVVLSEGAESRQPGHEGERDECLIHISCH